jgi:hypothetical protein
MNPTKPPLARIEARWFSPSDRLLARIARNDPTVPEPLRRAVDDDPDYCHCVELLRASKPEPASAPSVTPALDPGDLLPPAWLLDLADRRAAAADGAGAPLQPGCLVAIDRLLGPAGELPIDFASTAAVLLDDREDADDVWCGWLAAPETGYASAFDFLLDERDGPFDAGLAGMVQLWNPVRVYARTVARRIGRLPPERLRAVRALAGEYVARPALGVAGQAAPPHGPRLTLGGQTVTTGTPLEGPSDPRWRYQEIYLQVGRAVSEPALAALAARPWWESLWQALAEALAPEATPAVTMGAGDEPGSETGLLAGRFRISLDDGDPRVLALRAIRLDAGGSSLRLLRNGQVVQRCRPEETEKRFLLDEAGAFALEVVGRDGEIIQRIELSERTDP